MTGRREYELDKFQALTGQITTALEQGQKTLVYFPTVSLLERFYTHCLAQRLGNAVTRYHAQLSGEAKAENLEDFRSGKPPDHAGHQGLWHGHRHPGHCPCAALCPHRQPV